MRKCTVLVLVTVLVASSLMVVLPASLAQTKPATPTFTIEYPDEYAQHYLKIKNQPFAPYTSNGATVNLYYQARYKVPNGDEWWFINYAPSEYVLQTDSQDYSIITIGQRDGHQIDVQVRALVGTITYVPSHLGIMYGYWEFKGVESDWSSTQTVTLNPPTSLPASPSSSNTPYPSATQNPSSPNQPNTDSPSLFGLASWIGIALVILLCVVVVLLAIIAAVLWKKNVSQFNSSLNTGVSEG
jgi:hypothetical protein